MRGDAATSGPHGFHEFYGAQMSQMKISVITVCFNAAETIERTIRSVSSQTYSNIEYIIVDGDSIDQTLAIIQRYSDRFSKLVSERDKGIFDAMNKGIALATGEIVYFLNADDYFVDERVLSDIARAFQEDSSRKLVYGNVILKGEPNGLLSFPARAFKTRSISEFLHNSFCHQAVFVRRSLFSQLGLFDKRYKYSADYEWIIRAFKFNSGKDFFFLNRNIAYYSCQGRSNQYVEITRKEVAKMQFRHFLSLEYLWYFFRYVFIRRLKKRMLNETN
jgi:glycosyltransferase involved in cell wall biosynthesis